MSATSAPEESSTASEGDRLALARRRIAQEMLDTERSYVTSLRTVIEYYINPLRQALAKKKPILTEEQITSIFSCIELIVNVNEELLTGLQERVDSWHDMQRVGDVFQRLAPFLKSYTQYCNQFEQSNDVVARLSTSGKFKKFLRKQNEIPETRKLGLESFLIMPVQRVPRYVLLLNEMLRKCPDTHPDHASLQEALALMQQVANGVNAGVKEFQSRGMLYAIEQDLNLHIGLVQPHRVFIKEGVFEGRLRERSRPQTYKLYLINDLIILASEGRYLDRVSLQVLFVQDMDGCDFRLVSPTSTVNETHILTASSEADKAEWVELLQSSIDELMKKKPLYKNQRAKMEAAFQKKASMSSVERRQALREEKKMSKKWGKTKSDDRFQTIRF